MLGVIISDNLCLKTSRAAERRKTTTTKEMMKATVMA